MDVITGKGGGSDDTNPLSTSTPGNDTGERNAQLQGESPVVVRDTSGMSRSPDNVLRDIVEYLVQAENFEKDIWGIVYRLANVCYRARCFTLGPKKELWSTCLNVNMGIGPLRLCLANSGDSDVNIEFEPPSAKRHPLHPELTKARAKEAHSLAIAHAARWKSVSYRYNGIPEDIVSLQFPRLQTISFEGMMGAKDIPVFNKWMKSVDAERKAPHLHTIALRNLTPTHLPRTIECIQIVHEKDYAPAKRFTALLSGLAEKLAHLRVSGDSDRGPPLLLLTDPNAPVTPVAPVFLPELRFLECAVGNYSVYALRQSTIPIMQAIHASKLNTLIMRISEISSSRKRETVVGDFLKTMLSGQKTFNDLTTLTIHVMREGYPNLRSRHVLAECDISRCCPNLLHLTIKTDTAAFTPFVNVPPLRTLSIASCTRVHVSWLERYVDGLQTGGHWTRFESFMLRDVQFVDELGSRVDPMSAPGRMLIEGLDLEDRTFISNSMEDGHESA